MLAGAEDEAGESRTEVLTQFLLSEYLWEILELWSPFICNNVSRHCQGNEMEELRDNMFLFCCCCLLFFISYMVINQ